jgi:anti-sigma28 factor (negative regulator of flagellin synthesis)
VKIDPKYQPKVGGEAPPERPANASRLKGPDAQGSARPGAPPAADGLVLTPRAEEFRQLRLRLQSLPEPDASSRVATLKALVDRGTYVVEGGRIAGAMLQDEPTASLLGLRQS